MLERIFGKPSCSPFLEMSMTRLYLNQLALQSRYDLLQAANTNTSYSENNEDEIIIIDESEQIKQPEPFDWDDLLS